METACTRPMETPSNISQHRTREMGRGPKISQGTIFFYFIKVYIYYSGSQSNPASSMPQPPHQNSCITTSKLSPVQPSSSMQIDPLESRQQVQEFQNKTYSSSPSSTVSCSSQSSATNEISYHMLKVGSYIYRQIYHIPLIKEAILSTDGGYYRIPQLVRHRKCTSERSPFIGELIFFKRMMLDRLTRLQWMNLYSMMSEYINLTQQVLYDRMPAILWTGYGGYIQGVGSKFDQHVVCKVQKFNKNIH